METKKTEKRLRLEVIERLFTRLNGKLDKPHKVYAIHLTDEILVIKCDYFGSALLQYLVPTVSVFDMCYMMSPNTKTSVSLVVM